jgi:hypothetical protein
MKLFDALIINSGNVDSKPKIIRQLWCIHYQLRSGYWKCKWSFGIWKFMMTHNMERLNERCHGLNTFDEFYACLGGCWGGAR